MLGQCPGQFRHGHVAVESIRRWWHHFGKERHPEARKLLITADCGDSNGSRVRLSKVELQKLACKLGIEISVCHLPPGTSKWNRIEHEIFYFISQNWRGKPLYTLTTIISLIGSTSTGTGLKVYCDRDTNEYPTGIKISKSEIQALDIRRADFHGDWNYALLPNPDNVSVISRQTLSQILRFFILTPEPGLAQITFAGDGPDGYNLEEICQSSGPRAFLRCVLNDASGV